MIIENGGIKLLEELLKFWARIKKMLKWLQFLMQLQIIIHLKKSGLILLIYVLKEWKLK